MKKQKVEIGIPLYEGDNLLFAVWNSPKLRKNHSKEELVEMEKKLRASKNLHPALEAMLREES